MYKLSCQACHIPYALTGPCLPRHHHPRRDGHNRPLLFRRPARSHRPGQEPLVSDLHLEDRHRRRTADLPGQPVINIYWANWDQNGTPDDLSDDVVSPLLSWQIRQAIGPTRCRS